jgi:hypothetical protein
MTILGVVMDNKLKITKFIQSIFGLLLFTMMANAQAYVGMCCGKCGGNMPMNIPGGGIPETHEYRVKMSFSQMHMEGLRNGTSNVDVDSLLGMPVMMGNPTGKYMAAPTAMDMNMMNITTGYSFSDRFFAGIMFMYTRKDMDMKFNNMMQTLTGQNSFTMKSEGIGDTMFMAKYQLFADDPLMPTNQASLLFGLNLPTGSIDERNTYHPVSVRQSELLPYGMQLGSGTFDPTLGYLFQSSRSPYWWGINASYTARLYDNDRNYRLGDESRVDVYGMYQFQYNWLFQLQLNLHHQGAISGEADEALSGASGHVTQDGASSPYVTPLWDTSNYGGTQLFTTIGVQWQPAPLHIVDFNIGLPLYRDLNGPQLEQDYRVMLTWFIEIPTSKSRRYKMSNPTANSSLGF